MGKALLFGRLAAKDFRRHFAEGVLLFLVLAAAATTLTLGLVLHGETTDPYNTTRAATNAPDVVANLSPTFTNHSSIDTAANPADLTALEHAPGVTTFSGPYPVTFALVATHGVTTTAMLEGRDPGRANVDQPALTVGDWVRPGGVVVERGFADALRVRVGDSLTLNGRSYEVVGIAVDAAIPSYPHVCGIGCIPIYRDAASRAQIAQYTPGLVWLPRSDAVSLATPIVGLSYLTNLKLADPARAPTFASAQTPSSAPALTLNTWQDVSAFNAKLVRGPRTVLLVGSGLLLALALASVAVLVGGRLSEQTRRVGLLKAVGATPITVAAVLLVEHLAVTFVAALAGLAIGRGLAPLLTRPGAGLLGTAGQPPITATTIAIVIGVSLAVAVMATLRPALQAARTSTINALADAARSPRRSPILIAISTRLPIPLLFGVRLTARRPRRLALGMLSVAISEAGIVAILIEHARLDLGGTSGLVNPQHQRLTQAMLVITVMLVVIAAVNALLITSATVVDARHASAVARALGATPQQVSAGVCAAQFLAVLPGSLLGIPLGIGLIEAVTGASDAYKVAPIWWYVPVILVTWLTMGTLTAIPALLGSRHSAAQILQAELS